MKEIIIDDTFTITQESLDKFKLENPFIQLIQTILTYELILLTSTITLILMNMNNDDYIYNILYFNHCSRNNSISL